MTQIPEDILFRFARGGEDQPEEDQSESIEDWDIILRRTYCIYWLFGFLGKNFLSAYPIEITAGEDDLSIDGILKDNAISILLFKLIVLVVRPDKSPAHSDLRSY